MISKDEQQIRMLKTDRALSRRDPAWFWPRAHLILIAFYFLALLPMTFDEARYHGDELFYTDGAIGMIQTGDYVTPYYSSGVTRFRKPVFAYWTIAASYKLFGISLFASRMPFLLAGCLVIWFTYKISFALLRREKEAVAATVVIFSNIQLLTLSTRSTPDILQCSFLMAGLYGFSNILFHRSKTILDYSYAYLGSAFAIATKGLLGIFPVLFSFLLSLTRKHSLARPKDLINFKIIVIAAGVALFWFFLIFFKHGLSSITGFLGDQLTERTSGSKLYVAENIFSYLWALIRHFFPWSIILILLALPGAKDKIRKFVSAHKDASIFILGWYAILFLVFIWANIKRTRYLFPAYPLLAVMLSAMLVRIMDEGHRIEVIIKLQKILLLTGLVGAALLAACGLFIDVRIVAGGAILFVLTLFLYLTFFKQGYMGGLVATGAFLVLLFSIFFTFVKPVFYVSPARDIARHLEPLANQGPIEVGSIDYPRDFVHQVTLFSSGKIWVRTLRDDTADSELRKYPAIILAESSKDKLQKNGYQVVRCGYSYKEKWKPKEILEYITTSDKKQFLASRKETYYIALPK